MELCFFRCCRSSLAINTKKVETKVLPATACLLKNEPASASLFLSKWQSHGGIVKASVNSANDRARMRPEAG